MAAGERNDQVHFELTFYALQPSIKIIEPWRMPVFYERSTGRNDLLNYGAKSSIPVSNTKSKPWSMDENLAHCNYEAGIPEDPDVTPPADMWKLIVNPLKPPDKPENFTLVFAHRHGVGRIDIVENRFIGLKSRGCYETPGLSCLRSAHIDLEGRVLDHEILYNGIYFFPEREFLEESVVAFQKSVNGQVRCRVYKGTFTVLGRSSETEKLYDASESSMDEIGAFEPSDTTGFISAQPFASRNTVMLRPPR